MMKRFTAALVLTAALMAQKPEAAESLLQAAIKKEVVDGNLKAAAEGYQKAFAAAKGNRAVAAQALLHLAECHQKMGDAEAQKLYAQVVREYTDQKEAVAQARSRLEGGPPSSRQTNTLVWKGGSVDSEGTVSPDGKYISVVDWDTGNVALHEIATGENRVLVDAKNPKEGRWTAFAEESAISKDGKQVAYAWWVASKDRYELWVANLSGDPNPRRLYDDANNEWLAPYDWSRDGKWIAAVKSARGQNASLGLVSTSDGSWRPIRSGRGLEYTKAYFSPDGRYVGYNMTQAGASNMLYGNALGAHDVWISATDGSGHVLAVENPSHDYMMGWSPDGKRLLFNSDRNGSMTLWSVAFGDGKTQGVPEIIKSNIGLVDPMGMTRNGALFYGMGYGVAAGNVQIGSFDLASGKISSAHDVSPSYLEDNVNPCWSPDGRYFAYLSLRGRQGTSQVIVIRSAETGEVIRELRPEAKGSLDQWAPDGRSFLWHGEDTEGKQGIFSIDVQSGKSALLVENPKGQMMGYPVWSKDGQSIYSWRAYSSEKQAIFQRNIATGAEKELVQRPYLRGVMLLSPDGKYLVVASVDSASNSRNMLLVPTGGGEPRELMRVPSDLAPADLKIVGKGHILIEATWMPDSRSVILRERRSPDADLVLWQVPIDGSAPRKLDSLLPRNINRFTLNPDGSKVIFRQADPGPRPTPEIWVLENFLGAAK